MKQNKLYLQLRKGIREAECSLPSDVERALREAWERESIEYAKLQLEVILENVERARKEMKPVCQDTGLLSLYIKAGLNCEICGYIKRLFREAVIEESSKIPLRPNVVEPFTRVNSNSNVGWGLPHISVDFDESYDGMEMVVVPRGAGSMNSSFLGMFSPNEIDELKRVVLEHVINRARYTCPPLIVGIGIGGSPEQSLLLSELAVLRDIGSRDNKYGSLEDSLLSEINQLGIGVMGLGGDTTALDVHIEWRGTHTASLPISITLQCWALRKYAIKTSCGG
ncbi:fumarate hydratase [Candidatus Bathyarchaeota archaeon ex4484_205]|nr:MAG: fumarate hydratase [Candidatus Bathyarchaeota archaeon ex4484_205]